jgi:histidyl-tRNA synthetase
LLQKTGLDYKVNDQVKRGLSYYVEDGFEAECESLGAQKQIAGGGRYADGIGFAFGIDRVLLAKSLKDK